MENEAREQGVTQPLRCEMKISDQTLLSALKIIMEEERVDFCK